MPRILTADERQTLNDAMDILKAHTPGKASWVMSVSANYADASYFDSREDVSTAARQHNSLWKPGCTFADKVQMAIDIEADLIVNAEAYRAARAAQLREELAKLEQAA